MKNAIEKTIKKIPKDFVHVFSFDMLGKVFMIIMGILIIRILDTNQYAEFVKFTTLSNFILGVFGTGVSLSYIRYSAEQISRGNEKVNIELHTLSSIFLIALFLVVACASPIIGKVFIASSKLIFCASLYGFIISLIKINQYFYQAQESYIKSGMVDNVKNMFLCFTLLVIYFIKVDIDLNAVIIVYIFTSLVALILGWIRIYKKRKLCFMEKSVVSFWLMFRESSWLIIYYMILNLFNKMDVVMLSNFASDNEVAIYGVAYKYYSVMLTLLPSIQAILRVRASNKTYVDSKIRRYEFTLFWLKSSYKLIIPICIVTIILSDFFMPILNGSRYDASIPILKILIVGAGVSYIFAPNVVMMLSAKRYKSLCIIATCSLLLTIVGNLLFIPIWGAKAAAVTNNVAQAFLNIVSTLIVIHDARKEIKNEEFNTV